ncbi:hypothetical protein LTT66_22715 [Nocardia gipuzkoensis]|uniref:hypothetical protein n=1 Tax=Nocardia gipuzkoensis TaxID=2749991 RepID=UPI001E5C7B5A|nr:hypothetical protein [Nocardia gipuzkoensis]UGT66111.1 hypothetical protein LTT66_22715 [Nocardia gipuzkoensis]
MLSSDFSGGDATVANLLGKLGSTVTRPESLPDWTRDELILALDAYLKRRGQGSWSKTTKEAVALSAALRRLTIHPPEVRENPNFRNAAGVALEVSNFAAIDPAHPRTGMQHGAQGNVAVWNEWADRSEQLHQVALAVLRAGDVPETNESTEEEEESARRKPAV